MKYKEYLEIKHWKDFRKKILSKRNSCQCCGSKKDIFNIHHRNYNNLFNETNKDVLVLCKKCHYKFHKRKKWKKWMRLGKDLHFTEAQNQDSAIYNVKSKIKRKCNRCGEYHSIFYKQYELIKRLVIICPNSKPRLQSIPFEENLDILTINGFLKKN